jgi:hypothetical protein
VGVAPGRPAAGADRLRVGDVHAAEEALTTVDDRDLAVSAEVDPRPDRHRQARRTEARDLAAGGDERGEEAGPGAGADVVDQQPNAHAGARPRREQLEQAAAGRVGIVDVGLEVDVAARARDRGEERGERRFAVDVDLELGGGRHGRLVQVQAEAHLAQDVRRERHAALDLGDLRRELEAQVAVAQAPALEPPRADQQVDRDSDHRQQDEDGDPGERRLRRTLLERQPRHHADDPDELERGEDPEAVHEGQA